MAENNHFIERSLMAVLVLFKESIFSEDCASRKGFLQARDPRVKALMIFVLLLAALFSRSIPFIAGIYGFCLVLALVSSIDILFFWERTLFFIPFFSLFIAAPALFNIFTPGEPLASFHLFGMAVSITKQGAASAGIFFLRVLTSVSLCVLLALTTRHSVLLKVLRVFKVPQIFVMIMGMCYRYIYLFMEIIQDTYTAIKSRCGNISSSARGRKIVAGNIANLWRRSYDMHNQVYSAMISRGYSGEPKVMDEFRAGLKDWLCLGVTLSVFILSLWQNQYLN
jgi:cobalt/nickel transport system permease protein